MAHPPTRPPAPKRRPFTNGTPAPVGTPRRVGTPAGPSPHGAAVYTPGSYRHEGYGGVAELDDYATGGVVPGPRGKPQLAVVHGGEQITPVNQSAPDREENGRRGKIYQAILAHIGRGARLGPEDMLQLVEIGQVDPNHIMSLVNEWFEYVEDEGLSDSEARSLEETTFFGVPITVGEDDFTFGSTKYNERVRGYVDGTWPGPKEENVLLIYRTSQNQSWKDTVARFKTAQGRELEAALKRTKEEKFWDQWIEAMDLSDPQSAEFAGRDGFEQAFQLWLDTTRHFRNLDKDDPAGHVPFDEFVTFVIGQSIGEGKGIPTFKVLNSMMRFEQYLKDNGLYPDLTNPIVRKNYAKWFSDIEFALKSDISALPSDLDGDERDSALSELFSTWAGQMPSPDVLATEKLTARQTFVREAMNAGFTDEEILDAVGEGSAKTDQGMLLQRAYRRANRAKSLSQEAGETQDYAGLVTAELEDVPDILAEAKAQQETFYSAAPPAPPTMPADFSPNIKGLRILNPATGNMEPATEEQQLEHFAVLAGYRDTRPSNVDPATGEYRPGKSGAVWDEATQRWNWVDPGTSAADKYKKAQAAGVSAQQLANWGPRLAEGAKKFMDEYNESARQMGLEGDEEPQYITLEQATTMVSDDASLSERYVPEQKQPTLTRAQVEQLPGSKKMIQETTSQFAGEVRAAGIDAERQAALERGKEADRLRERQKREATQRRRRRQPLTTFVGKLQ